MTTQSVQDSPHGLVLDCSQRTAKAAALIITALRGATFAVTENTDWETLLDLAHNNGVLLLVLQSLLEHGVEVPSLVSNAAHQSGMAAERLATELEALLDGLAEERIEVLPLKGPVLSLAVYHDAVLRSSSDLDLLVRDRDFPRAEAFLLSQGFLVLPSGREYHGRFLRGDLLVELHFALASSRFLAFPVHGIWSRSYPWEFRGKPVRMMSKEDLVLYLCFHGSKHRFSRLIWILDVARALRGWPDRDYELLLVHARRQRLAPWLFIGCEVVRSMFPNQLPEAMATVIASSPDAARRARSTVEHLFMADLQVNLNDQRQLYLRAETNVFRRWGCRLEYFTPNGEDYLWARRHRIKPQLMVVVRPFRLLEKYGPRKLWHALFPSRP
jgi:hypothetical protein